MVRSRYVVLALVGLAIWSAWNLDLEASRLGEAPAALARLANDAWPPHTGEDGTFLIEVAASLMETLQIAFLATLLGALLSLPLAILASRTLVSSPLAAVARTVAAAIRVLPSLLWAVLAVLIVGLGPLAGVLAMTFYTVGYLSKQQSETLEGVPRDALDAVRAMRATRFQQAWHVAIPEAGNALRSQLLFMFEYNVRASSIIGLVGAGGVGQLLSIHLRFAQYGHILTILLALFALVALLDVLGILVRRRFVELAEGARWKEAAADAARPR